MEYYCTDIWYQSFTGLLQTTILSCWAILFVPHTELAYAVWIILVLSTTQYPGFLAVFTGILNALQQFNKRATVEFIQSEAIQRITEILFVLLGKWYGMTHPQVGMLMGIAIGSMVGLYVDDFIAAVLSGYFISRSLGHIGLSFGRCFRVEFDWPLVKQCFIFGLKTGLPGLLNGVTNFISLWLMISFIPQYTTYIVLKDMAYMLIATVGRVTNQDFAPLLAESYLNGKKKLTQYYVSSIFRFFTVNQGFAFAILITAYTMFGYIFAHMGLDRYMLTIPFIIPCLFLRASGPYVNLPDALVVSANRPNIIIVFRVVEEVGKMVSLWVAIVVFRVQDFGMAGIVYVLVFGDFPGTILKSVVAYLYVHKSVLPFRFLTWQTFIVPPLATLIRHPLIS